MPYIGNNHIAGDHTNNFKVLDDISSYTATFNGSASSVVDTTNNTIRVVEHRFIQGQRVTYTNGGGGNIGGLTTGTAYFIIHDSASTFKLATSASNAASSTAINLSAVGTGSSHTLNAAFDGVNTKFKLTHSSGTGARLNNATQVNVAINNVLQKPNQSVSYTEGFIIEDNHKIAFKTAPTSEDIFWGSIIANTLTTFDISDHKIDTFTGDGSTTEFTLSHTPANNESLMVTINGVLQHPSNASTVRAYTLIASIIQFTAAPGVGDEIQVRHIGFAGATTADVSGFYGRTGNVVLTSNDHITTGDITARNINASGILTASSASFGGNVSIGGTLTYEDVSNIDSVGIITARDGIDCNGDLDVDGHTNLDNVSVAGVTTFSDNIHVQSSDDTLALFESTDSLAQIQFKDNSSNANLPTIGIQANSFYFNNLGSTSLRIAPGKVGVNEANPECDFHVNQNNAHTSTYYLDSDAGVLVENINGGANKKSVLKLIGNSALVYGFNGSGTLTFAQRQKETANFDTNGNFSLNYDLDVDGHTNLDNVSIAGVTTMGQTTIAHTSAPQLIIKDSDTTGAADSNGISFQDASNTQYGFIGQTSSGGHTMLITTTNTVNPIRLQVNSSTKLEVGHTGTYVQNGNFYVLGGYSSNISGDVNLNSNAPTVNFNDSNANPDYKVFVNTGVFKITDTTNNVDRITIASAGQVGIGTDNPGSQSSGANNLVVAEFGGEGGITIKNDTNSMGHIFFADTDATAQGRIDYGHSGDYMRFYTANNERLRIDSSGRLLVNGATNNNAFSAGDDLVIGNTSSGTRSGITLVSNSSEDGGLYFSDGTSSGNAHVQGQIVYDHSGNFLRLYTSATERLRITSDGQLIHNAENSSGHVAEFNQTHASNDARILINSPTDNNIRPAFIQLSNAGTAKWGIGQVYASTSSGAFHLLAGNNQESNSKFVVTTAGRTGIGTINPTTLLHIDDDSADPYLRIGGSGRDCGIQLSANANYTAFRADGANRLFVNAGADSIRFSIGGTSSSNEKLRIESDGNLHIKGTNHATRYYRDAGDRYGSIFYDGGHFVIRQPLGDNLDIQKFDGTVLHRFNTAGSLSVGHDSPDRTLHVKSGVNNNNGAFRIESAPGNIMDMGTDSSMHFLNCVNDDPFRIKFAGNEALRLTHETSGNGSTTLQFYMVTNNNQGATPYIKGVCGSEAGGADINNDGGLEFHSKTGGSGTDVNAMRINANGRVAIGAHNIQNPTAALHIIGDTSGSNTALQVGQDSGQRYFRVNEINGQSNFLECLLSYYDNTLAHVLKLQNTFAGSPNFGTAIQFIGHGGTQTGRIAVKNRDANSASNSIMELSASYVTKPSHPCFDANRTAGAVSSVSVIAFNVATTNNGNHYDTSNGRFTAPVDGHYQFWFGAIKQDTTSVVRLHMRKNGSTSNMNDGRQLRLDSHGGGDGRYGENGAVTLIASLNANDYVQVVVTAGTVYGSGSDYTYFCGTLIG